MKPLVSCSLTLLMAFLLALPAAAIDWRVKVGLHDFVVPTESSHTLSINGQLFLKHQWSSGLRYEGSYDLCVEDDQDKLDPDYIAVWWKFYAKLDRDIYAISLLAEGNIKLGDAFGPGGLVQSWASKDHWLEHRLRADISWETPAWKSDSRIIFSAEYCEYNLDPYTPSTEAGPANEHLPILPWNDDLEIRLV